MDQTAPRLTIRDGSATELSQLGELLVRVVGRALTMACVELAPKAGHATVVLHTTKAMEIAWGMYERLGFVRAEDLEFLQQGLQVFGVRRWLG